MKEQKESPVTLESVKKMSDEELRIAVAEAHGWEIVNSYSTSGAYGYWKTQPSYDKAELPPMAIPDYPHDLNAVHEVEKVLTLRQRIRYMEILLILNNKELVLTEGAAHDKISSYYFVACTSSARQRCEALVLCLSPRREKAQRYER